MIVRDWLAAAAASRPSGTALTYYRDGQRHSLTLAELNTLVSRWTAALANFGVNPGDHVGLLMPNNEAAVFIILAAARRGAVLVPLNTRLTTDELGYQITKSRCATILFDPQLSEQIPTLDQGSVSLIEVRPELLPAGDFDAVYHDGAYDLNAVQAIIFTSGTTGQPKGAQITFGNHYFSALGSAARIGLDPGDSWLVCLPFYHVGGLAIIFRSLLYNTAVSLFDMRAGFDPAALMQHIVDEPVTLISLVPTMLWRMLDAGFADPAHLRLILLGGAATTPELIERCRGLRLPIVTTYGMTEATSQVATLLPEGVYAKPGSVGRPLMFTQVAVVDGHGAPLPAGEVGEIVVSGLSVMHGYFDETHDDKKRGNRLFTGDLGYLDADGDLWILQRRSDLIISGGENIYPAEVESVLRRHPAVADVCVVGVPDPEWGQRVAAAVVLKSNAVATADELTTFCRDHLAGYKIPRAYKFLKALPQTASGKVQRSAVQRLMAVNSAD